ncbi:MAG: N-acetyltransferase [Defluviitaleaceae bacterium]|nr:N-acetyltransferase [Defluviitaleaceae bacterium]
MDLILRHETPADYYAVEELTREAFWTLYWGSEPKICDEHLLVSRLRQCAAFVPELNYVAEADSKVVGHIIYSKSKVVDESGDEHETLTFGPLSTLPEYQGKGIGKALMLHTFHVAREMGFRAVIIFGHPDFYPRVGFRRASEFGITDNEGKSYDPLMALPLYDGALTGIRGRYSIDPVYESLNQKDTLEFDKKFPPKEIHKPILIDVLLNRLEPVPRNAIKGLDFQSLTQIQTKSEDELSALDGINADAINIIRTVMGAYGLRWGVSIKTDSPRNG